MKTQLTRERAWEILTRYNKEEFHRQQSFAAGCSREIISAGAERRGISLDELIVKTIEALRSLEREKGIV